MAMHKKIKVKPDGSIEFQHFDSGGTVIPNNTGSTYNNGLVNNPVANGATYGLSGNAGNLVQEGENSVGGAAQGAASAFTAQDQFQANAPDISQQNANYENANQGQDQLEQALTNQANGVGPNPAQAQFQQNTNTNGQEAAGLVASQRGLNPGEAARMGSEAEVGANQTAAGQAATLQAQQQLASEGQLGSVYGTQEGAANQNASVANQGQLGAAGINAQTASQNAAAVNKTEGGLLNGAGSLAALLAKGGVVGKDGKKVENPKLETVPKSDRFKGNLMPSHLKDVASIYHGQHFDDGGQVDEFPLASVNIPTISQPSQSSSSSGGGSSGGSGAGLGALMALMSKGGDVPGKPKVNHDAYKNDTVNAELTPGEVVIDLDTMKEKGPMGDAARMLAQHIEDKNGHGDHEDDFKQALSRAVAGRKRK